MKCETLDELAAAYALGAVEPAEERAIARHLASCDEAHAETRALIDAAQLVPASLDEVAPPAPLRARLMTTVAATAQEHRRPAQARPGQGPPARNQWWRMSPDWWRRMSPVALTSAAAALALVVGLGAWNVTLQQELAQRERVVRAVAAADIAHRVTGSAGSGWLLETQDAAVFLADGLAALPQDRIYELWLIDADGTPVDVGTVDRVDDLIMVPLERRTADAAAFAVTIEEERVDAPTTEPVLIASLEG